MGSVVSSRKCDGCQSTWMTTLSPSTHFTGKSLKAAASSGVSKKISTCMVNPFVIVFVMPTLYHKSGRLSRGKSEFYCKTSAPRKPTKQAPISKNKNVILFSFHSIIYYRHVQPQTLREKNKKAKSFLIEIESQQWRGAGPPAILTP